jgi:WD40 repeat protein
MKDHGYETGRIPRRIFGLRSSLGIVAMWVCLLSYLVMTEEGCELGAGAKKRPFGQVAQEDLGEPVCALAFSADGIYLASATIIGDVWLKELPSGRVVRFEHRRSIWVQSLAFAPSGHVLAIAGDHPAVLLWDVDADKELATLEVAGGFAKSIAFSTDGTTLAVTDCGGGGKGVVVTLWDWRKGRRLAALEGHRGQVNALAYSVDGSWLASGDSHGVVKVWDMTTRRERTSVQANELGRSIESVAFSPDGRLLMTADRVDREVRLWDAATGAPRGTLLGTVTGVNALAFSPQGTISAVARGDGVVSLWDLVGHRELGALRTGGTTLQSVAFSRDGHQLATGGTDGALRLWDLKRVLPGHSSPDVPGPTRGAPSVGPDR